MPLLKSCIWNDILKILNISVTFEYVLNEFAWTLNEIRVKFSDVLRMYCYKNNL